MVVFIMFKYLCNIVYYIGWSNFFRMFLTVYLYFRYTPIMFPKKCVLDGGKEKRKTTRATLGVLKEMIAEHENGVRVSDLASNNGMPKSTISTFLKNKEIIEGAKNANRSKVISKEHR